MKNYYRISVNLNSLEFNQIFIVKFINLKCLTFINIKIQIYLTNKTIIFSIFKKNCNFVSI